MASAYVVHSFPVPVVVIDNNENASYVVGATTVIASPSSPSNTFTQGFFMVPSVLALLAAGLHEICPG